MLYRRQTTYDDNSRTWQCKLQHSTKNCSLGYHTEKFTPIYERGAENARPDNTGPDIVRPNLQGLTMKDQTLTHDCLTHVRHRSLSAVEMSIRGLHLWHQSIAVEKCLDPNLDEIFQQFGQKRQVGL